MSEPSNGAWPFQEIPEEEGLDSHLKKKKENTR